MTDRAALFREILENPADDTVRLAYADAVQEEGDEPRAEFIRAQITVERAGPPHKKITNGGDEPVCVTDAGDGYFLTSWEEGRGIAPGDRVDVLCHRPLRKPKWRYGLRVVKFRHSEDAFQSTVVLRQDERSGPWAGTEAAARAGTLLDTHALAWGADTFGPPDARPAELSYSYRRGFVDHVALPCAEFLRACGRRLFARAPITHVGLTDKEPHHEEGSPYWSWHGPHTLGHMPLNPNRLPAALWLALPHTDYPSLGAANAALSTVCVGYGLEAAGITRRKE